MHMKQFFIVYSPFHNHRNCLYFLLFSCKNHELLKQSLWFEKGSYLYIYMQLIILIITNWTWRKQIFREIFLLFHDIVYCVYSLELPYQGDSNEYTQHTITQNYIDDQKRFP